MAGFTIDLAGRVKNFDLPKTQPLIPLFEAVVNSIYAIEEKTTLVPDSAPCKGLK